jgi:poly-gamma-glutamate synthesis protein (capsule biosynthesis protein)
VLAVLPASQVGALVRVATVDGVDPLRQPRRYPLNREQPGNPPVVTTVLVVGDIMLGRRVAGATPGDPGKVLAPLIDYLRRFDLTVGNLESTLSRAGKPRQGTDSFAAPPAALDALADAGFDLLSLANNHTGDFGDRALRRTLRRFDTSPVRRVGAGFDAVDAWRPAVLEHKGVRFGFLAFNAIGETPRATATSPGAAEVRMQPRTGPLNRADLARLRYAVRRLAKRTDAVIVLPHWGDQYTSVPVADQRIVGAALVDAGADLVVGGHPHWVQGVQVHRGRLVAHSLGNFVFDMDFSRETREGATLELVFWNGRLKSARFAPYVIGDDFAARLVDGPAAAAIIDRIRAASDPPFSR